MTARVIRLTAAAAVTVDFSMDNARATVSPANVTLPPGQLVKELELTVTGVTASGANRDTLLLAKVGADKIGSLVTTVTVAKSWSTDAEGDGILARAVKDPQPDRPGEEINEFDLSARGGTSMVSWSATITLTVFDQFGARLGPAWSESGLQQNIDNKGWRGFGTHPSSVILGTSSRVQDPVEIKIENISATQANFWWRGVIARLDLKGFSGTIDYRVVDSSGTVDLDKENLRTISFIRTVPERGLDQTTAVKWVDKPQ